MKGDGWYRDMLVNGTPRLDYQWRPTIKAVIEVEIEVPRETLDAGEEAFRENAAWGPENEQHWSQEDIQEYILERITDKDRRELVEDRWYKGDLLRALAIDRLYEEWSPNVTKR